MTTQKHLNGERECCPFLTDKCPPHVFLICLKFRACHDHALYQTITLRLRTILVKIVFTDDPRDSETAAYLPDFHPNNDVGVAVVNSSFALSNSSSILSINRNSLPVGQFVPFLVITCWNHRIAGRQDSNQDWNAVMPTAASVVNLSTVERFARV
jgi:hypothetical protein